MLAQTKTFYNAVIDADLFYTIYDYLRFHLNEAKENYNIKTTADFDNLSLEDWKMLADDTIMWLEHTQLPTVNMLSKDDPSPTMETWGTLYYQTCNYLGIKEIGMATLRNRDLNGTIKACINCIEYLKEKMNEIHPITDNDL